ncbi:MAG: ImmA/IrrE family metallo-endopeptidase [Dehalococcoidia bacterium]|nr:ImmA/IrrE family metallo-endopeptidase [Dehalococcoidia bacterium]
MRISRMDLDDVGASPQRIAEAVISQIPDLPIPIPVEEIACALGIVEIRIEPIKSFEGALITTGPEKAEGSILVNARSHPRRRRYTIGHELGHFLHPLHVPPAGGFHCTSDDMSRNNSAGVDTRIRQEIQANAFAAELMLPRSVFLRDLKRMRGLDLEHITELGNKYQVSKEAVARRYVHFQEEPSAIVFSHKGRVRYFCKHDDFPWLDVRSGAPVPAPSIAAASVGSATRATDWSEIDPSVWLSRPNQRGMCEQTLVQQAGYRMTLQALDDDSSEDEDEPALEESWTPKFRRK